MITDTRTFQYFLGLLGTLNLDENKIGAAGAKYLAAASSVNKVRLSFTLSAVSFIRKALLGCQNHFGKMIGRVASYSFTLLVVIRAANTVVEGCIMFLRDTYVSVC